MLGFLLRPPGRANILRSRKAHVNVCQTIENITVRDAIVSLLWLYHNHMALPGKSQKFPGGKNLLPMQS